jgi:hypothetical protein
MKMPMRADEVVEWMQWKISLLGDTLVLLFQSRFFYRQRKIKFRFFLVDVARGF